MKEKKNAESTFYRNPISQTIYIQFKQPLIQWFGFMLLLLAGVATAAPPNDRNSPPAKAKGNKLAARVTALEAGDIDPTNEVQTLSTDGDFLILSKINEVGGGIVPLPQGPAGPQGVMGPKGIQGLTGPKGARGAKGAKGARGARGIQGPKGNDGATGPAGSGNVVISDSAPTVNDDINTYAVGFIWVDTDQGDAYILIDNSPAAAEWKLITSTPPVYAIGDIGPAGGFVFLVHAGGQHGLEAAPEDQGSDSFSSFSSSSSSSSFAYWGCYEMIIDGADDIDDGAQNTLDILNDCPLSQAASLASDYVFGGYSDWYLPSKNELDAMYLNLAVNNKGGFANDFYWSSTESSEYAAWFQDFDGGSRDTLQKKSSLRVRAVRAF